MMNKLMIAIVLGFACVVLTEAFLGLGHKYKDGCDPNPCKHKGTCKLTDPHRNKNLSTCTCTLDYHGQHCELNTGCSKSPCKHKAHCTNNPKDLSDYSCKCTDGYVGKNCDKKNACEGTKNPCKNNGKCVIHPISGEQSCECPPGLSGKGCDKRVCNITEYKLKSESKKSGKIWLDEALKEKVKQIDDLAKLCKVHLHILRSHVQHPDPDPKKAHAYSPLDKTNPNFYIGQALAFQLFDTHDKLLCNEQCMSKVPCPVPEAKCFLDGLYAINMRTSILDPGVIHTDYHHKNTLKYNKHREAIQVGCHGKKF